MKAIANFMLFFIFCAFSLRDRAQVEQLLRYIIEEPPIDAEDKRVFKYAVLTNNLFQKSFCFNFLVYPILTSNHGL
jgi:hypothetical protein